MRRRGTPSPLQVGGRLFQQVREKKGLVHSVDAWTYSPGNPGLFGLSATVDAEKFSAAREAVFAEIERMKNTVVSSDELNKAVKQLGHKGAEAVA